MDDPLDSIPPDGCPDCGTVLQDYGCRQCGWVRPPAPRAERPDDPDGEVLSFRGY